MHADSELKPRQRGRSRPRGTSLVEAALVFSLILAPLLLGVITIGFGLIRAVQANQINRDAGHMFARGLDLTLDANGVINRGILIQMAPQLKTSTGTAVTILSWVKFLDSTGTNGTCPSGCSNLHQVVFLQQLVMGNPTLKASAFGTVPSGSMDATTGLIKDQFNDTAVRATGLLTYLPLTDGETAYVAETYFVADWIIPGVPSPAGVATRAFF